MVDELASDIEFDLINYITKNVGNPPQKKEPLDKEKLRKFVVFLVETRPEGSQVSIDELKKMFPVNGEYVLGYPEIDAWIAKDISKDFAKVVIELIKEDKIYFKKGTSEGIDLKPALLEYAKKTTREYWVNLIQLYLKERINTESEYFKNKWNEFISNQI
jgi:hypothetical protein